MGLNVRKRDSKVNRKQAAMISTSGKNGAGGT